MAKYRVQGPDGAIHVFDGPDGATQEQVLAAAQQQFGQPAPKAAGADDPGALMAALIGAGRTTDNIIDGMKQLGFNLTGNREALDQLRAEHDEKTRLYKPLQDQHSVATAIGEAVPSMVIPAGGGATLAATAARLAAAGALPGALEYGTAGERAGRAAGGAAAGVAGGVVLPKVVSAAVNAVPAIGRTAKAVVEPFTDGGRSAIAGRTLNKAAGDDAAQAVARLRAAQPVVPGSMPTVGQVAENGGLAALERAASATNPAAFTTRGMEQAAARTGALRTIAGDDAAFEAAKKYRAATAKKSYDNAFAAGVDQDMARAMKPQIDSIMGRPSAIKAIDRAKLLAREDDVTLSDMGSVQGLHYMKMALDDLAAESANNPTKQRLVTQTGRDFQSLLEQIAPEYKSATERYARNSVPVNQMEVGRELLDKMRPALADHGALAKETGANYALALRNSEQTAKRATGLDTATLDSVMDPSQMSLLNGIASDLARKANAQDLGRGAGSDTTQKLLMQNLVQGNVAERSGAPKLIAALPAVAGTVAGGMTGGVPGAVAGAGAGFGLGKVAKAIYGTQEEKIVGKIADALLDPSAAATLMTANPLRPQVPANQLLFANPGRAAQLLGGAAGFTAGNLAAQ